MAYTKPTPAELIARYPAFTDVASDVRQYWLTDAERFVDESWTETDYAPALMAMAAHNMTLAGLGSDAAATADIPSGISKLKSGSLDVTFTESAANARAAGSLDATRYGAEYKLLLKRNKGGPRVTETGTLPYASYRYVDGEDIF